MDTIVSQTIDALSHSNEFDEQTMTKLRDLAESGELIKYEAVVAALRPSEEE